MGLIKRQIGVNADGTPHYNYLHDDTTTKPNFIMTGPVDGQVVCSDGTVYDVGEAFIEVASEKHAGEVNHHIAKIHEARSHRFFTGEPGNEFGSQPVLGVYERDAKGAIVTHPDGVLPKIKPFVHECTEKCGGLRAKN